MRQAPDTLEFKPFDTTYYSYLANYFLQATHTFIFTQEHEVRLEVSSFVSYAENSAQRGEVSVSIV